MITKLGHFSLDKKKLTILFFIFFIPTLFLSYFSLTKLFFYKKLEAEIASIETLAFRSVDQRKRRYDFLMNHTDVQSNYVETLSEEFLSKEKKEIKQLDRHKIFREDAKVQARKKFLFLENKLHFQKGGAKQELNVRENRYFLKDRVEGSLEDVENLLFDLELKPKIPQCVLYDFQMDLTNRNTCIFNLLILQREFFKES